MESNLETLAWVLGPEVECLPYEFIEVLLDLLWQDKIVELIHLFNDFLG